MIHHLPLLISFLIGSIPFGLILGKLFSGSDIRKEGSGNIGATNVSRVAGVWPAGVLTFVLDLIKGGGPAFLFGQQGRELFQNVTFLNSADFGIELAWLCGLSSVIGHCFTPWLKFKGGKGVATGFGVLLVLSPWAALVGLLCFLVVFFAFRLVSLASLSALIAACVSHLVLHPQNTWPLAGAILAFVILIRHESNLDALLHDQEYQF